MTRAKKSFIISILFLSVVILLIGIFGNSGLFKNTEKRKEIAKTTESLSENEQKQLDSLQEANGARNQQLRVSDIDLDDLEGVLLEDTKTSTKIIITLVISLVLVMLCILILFKKTESESTYIDDANTKKQINKKFIDLSTNDGIKKISKIIQNGGVVIIPCDTMWGICALANDENKTKIARIKEREVSKEFITLCSKAEAKEIFGSNCPNSIYDKWPCALTVVSNIKLQKNKTLAIRVPKDKVLEKIIKETGAIYSTSVNKSGEESITNFDIIKKKFTNKVDAIGYNDKRRIPNIQSTIIDVTNVPYKILREGSISKKDLNL